MAGDKNVQLSHRWHHIKTNTKANMKYVWMFFLFFYFFLRFRRALMINRFGYGSCILRLPKRKKGMQMKPLRDHNRNT